MCTRVPVCVTERFVVHGRAGVHILVAAPSSLGASRSEP